MPRVTIDGIPVEVEAGATLLTAARACGVHIPTLCHRDGLEHNSACMVCVVAVEGQKRLLPACSATALEGMQVRTTGADIQRARRMAVELLLGDHAGDCEGPCRLACPAGFDAPGFLRMLARGDVSGAAELAGRGLLLPVTLGQICPAPCQRACRRAEHDSPLAIRELHCHVGGSSAASAGACSGRSVAVVGGGPAGLAAAYELRLRGHACTIFEAGAELGGGLLGAAAEGRLSRELVRAEIAGLALSGVRVECGRRIGGEELARLQTEYDGVILACGADAELASVSGVARAESAEGQAAHTALFVAGAMAGAAGRMAVRAIAQGREAARALERYLAGVKTVQPRPVNVRMGRVDAQEMALFLRCADARSGQVDEQGRRAGTDLAQEAGRCLHCDCRARSDCRLRAVAQELGASPSAYRGERRKFELDTSHPQIVFEPGKCITCGLCIQVARREGERLGHTFIGRGFAVRVGPPFSALVDEALAFAGGACVAVCPTGALTMRE